MLYWIRRYNIRGFNRWTIEYLDNDTVVYFGWMPGNISDVEYLKTLGVKGPMGYKFPSKTGDTEKGTIAQCVITKEVAEKLRDYDGFASSYRSFTGVNKYGQQVAWGIDDFEDFKDD